MRRIVLVLGILLAAVAPAVGDVPADQPVPPPPASHMRKPEVLQHKPSGFHLPNVPAKGGAYRYPLLGLGAGVVAITALLTIRYLRKVGRDRDRRP